MLWQHSPSIFGRELADEQGTDHPTDSKVRHSEGVQHGEEPLVWSPVVTFNNCLIVEMSDVLGEKKFILILFITLVDNACCMFLS